MRLLAFALIAMNAIALWLMILLEDYWGIGISILLLFSNLLLLLKIARILYLWLITAAAMLWTIMLVKQGDRGMAFVVFALGVYLAYVLYAEIKEPSTSPNKKP